MKLFLHSSSGNRNISACCQLHHGFFTQFVTVELAGNLPLVHDNRAIAHAKNFFQFAGNEQNPHSFGGQFFHEAIDFFFGSHIDTARWLVKQQQPWFQRKPLANHYLLLIPTGEILHDLTVVRSANAHFLDHIGRVGAFSALVQ